MPKSKLIWGSNEEKKGWQGLNNAAINSFNSNIVNSFIREMFQNSNDARDKSLPNDPRTGNPPPLHIVINYKTVPSSLFPDFDGFVDLVARVKSAPLNSRHSEFFRSAQKALGNREQIKLFVFEDFNTSGLSGADDDDDSTFSACVLSEGISVGKDKTSGGSYGIGKNAIFGFSKLRTVFYSSLNRSNEFIFQGRAKLATYFGKDGKKYSDKIFCGSGSDLHSVRRIEDLTPEHQALFKRSKPGLSQFAVCPSDHGNWIEEFAKAILRNYWLLLDKGQLIVELKQDDNLELTIEASSLEALFKKYFDPELFEVDKSMNPGGNPYEFYQCFKKGECLTGKVDIIGDVRFYFSEPGNDKTNAVAYLRNNMVIYTESIYGFKSINYCGVFVCDDDDGNSILRDMEPFTHDSFSPEQLDQKSDKYGYKDGKQILNGIRAVVRDCLQTISDRYKVAAQDIPWLDELLTAISGSAGNGSGNRTNTPSDLESPQRIGARFISDVEFKSKARNTFVYDPNGTVPGLGAGPMKPGPGNGGKKVSVPGSKPGARSLTKTRIKSRTFITNRKGMINGKEHVEYKLFLSSNGLQGTTDVILSQRGDAGNVVCFEVARVIDSSGKEIRCTAQNNSAGDPLGYRLADIEFPSELTLFVHEPYKSSFKIVNS